MPADDTITVTPEIKGFYYQRRQLRSVSHYGPVIRRFQRRWLRGRSGVFGRPTLEHQYDASRKRHDLWVLWDWADLPTGRGLVPYNASLADVCWDVVPTEAVRC